MDGFDEYIFTRQHERSGISKPRKCSECGVVSHDVDLFTDDPETGESVYMCTLCEGREAMAEHVADGFKVIGMVAFDGQACGALPAGWSRRIVYGSLLPDGVVLYGSRMAVAVRPAEWTPCPQS